MSSSVAVGDLDLEHDSLGLNAAIVSDSVLQSDDFKRKGRKYAKYHKRQNELIRQMLKPMDEHTAESREAEEAAALSVRIAVWASFLANVCLCGLQVYAAVSTLSLSLISTAIDSIFDIGSNALLWWLHVKSARLDVNKWPVGGSRLTTIGNICYGSLMGAVNLVVIVESIRKLITHDGDDADLNILVIPALVSVGAALGVKFALFLYCITVRRSSSQVDMLYEDHRNDLFVNGFGILMSAGGSKLKWWLDPMGGLLISTGIILAWGRTVYYEFELLAGKSAPHDFLQLIVYKTMMFAPKDIEKVDTVRAYHSGPNYFVEVDVVMSSDTPLWKAHDISQHLQDKIEVLPGVERAFVHVDHETTHRPEHRKVKHS